MSNESNTLESQCISSALRVLCRLLHYLTNPNSALYVYIYVCVCIYIYIYITVDGPVAPHHKRTYYVLAYLANAYINETRQGYISL